MLSSPSFQPMPSSLFIACVTSGAAVPVGGLGGVGGGWCGWVWVGGAGGGGWCVCVGGGGAGAAGGHPSPAPPPAPPLHTAGTLLPCPAPPSFLTLGPWLLCIGPTACRRLPPAPRPHPEHRPGRLGCQGPPPGRRGLRAVVQLGHHARRAPRGARCGCGAAMLWSRWRRGCVLWLDVGITQAVR